MNEDPQDIIDRQVDEIDVLNESLTEVRGELEDANEAITALRDALTLVREETNYTIDRALK